MPRLPRRSSLILQCPNANTIIPSLSIHTIIPPIIPTLNPLPRWVTRRNQPAARRRILQHTHAIIATFFRDREDGDAGLLFRDAGVGPAVVGFGGATTFASATGGAVDGYVAAVETREGICALGGALVGME